MRLGWQDEEQVLHFYFHSGLNFFLHFMSEDLSVHVPPRKSSQRREHKQLSEDTFQSKFLFNLDGINRGGVCVCVCAHVSDQV